MSDNLAFNLPIIIITVAIVIIVITSSLTTDPVLGGCKSIIQELNEEERTLEAMERCIKARKMEKE
jgi:hypothetical protein